MRNIICLSGGISSAWVAKWATGNLDKPIYYFNDTKWEHPDLYRFLNDIKEKLEIEIYTDTDGRTPEQVFYDQRMLGSNRTPICSKVLKAQMMQKFIEPGDTLFFGITCQETKRAARIDTVYGRLKCSTRFPIIEEMVTRKEQFKTIASLGIEIPQMYKDGFTHNNCSGGCVRAGKKQWRSLLNKYPGVYAERERVEREFSEYIGKPVHFMKEMSLKDFREGLEQQMDFDFSDDTWQGECVGICGNLY